MKTLTSWRVMSCTNCGFTANVGQFMDADEFFSCPKCQMDESGIIRLHEEDIEDGHVVVAVLWAERIPGTNGYRHATVPTIETGIYDHDGFHLDRPHGTNYLTNMNNIVSFHFTTLSIRHLLDNL